MKRKNHWVPVVTAIIKKKNSVLCGVRPEEGNLPGKWEFPGGKLEADESLEEALVRELKEELNIEAEVGPLVYATTHQYGEVGILLLFYEVLFWKGEPTSVHHDKLEWVEVDKLLDLDMPDANKKALPDIVEIIKS